MFLLCPHVVTWLFIVQWCLFSLDAQIAITLLEKLPEGKYLTIITRDDGYYVVSEKTEKNLGGPYKTKEEAEKRLRQVEYFKHKKGNS